MQIALLRADDIDRPSLPGVFPKNRQIEFQSFELFDHLVRWQAIDIEAKDHQRMNERPVGIDLTVLEDVNLIVGEKDSVAVLDWREIDPERSRNRKRFVPGLNLLLAVLVDVRSLLHERRGRVPRFGILLLHRADELIGGSDFSSKGRRADKKN